MIQTKNARKLKLAGFSPAGKHPNACSGLLPVLALCLATVAWSQTTLSPRGPHRQPTIPGAVPSTGPAADDSASALYKFITIGVPGSPNAQTVGINNARLASGYYQDASYTLHGFVWQAGALQTVDYPGAVYTDLQGVNNLSVVIGYYGDGAAEHAVMYSVPGGAWTTLPDIPGYADNEGYGINDRGFAVGTAFGENAQVGWIWNPTTHAYSFVAVPAAAGSVYANDINDKGWVVGSFADASGLNHGFVKQGMTYTTIDAPGATNTYPDGINNSGTIAGEWYDAAGAAQGFILTSGGLFTAVDYPGPELTAAEGINDHGDICGTYVDSPSGVRRAYIGLRP